MKCQVASRKIGYTVSSKWTLYFVKNFIMIKKYSVSACTIHTVGLCSKSNSSIVCCWYITSFFYISLHPQETTIINPKVLSKVYINKNGQSAYTDTTFGLVLLLKLNNFQADQALQNLLKSDFHRNSSVKWQLWNIGYCI